MATSTSIRLQPTVSQNGDYGSPSSEDLMDQFEGSLINPQPAPVPAEVIEESQQQPQLEAPVESTACEIALPTVDNIDEYDYLPGHFVVRRILGLDAENPKKPSYTVRLKSGERATVRHFLYKP